MNYRFLWILMLFALAVPAFGQRPRVDDGSQIDVLIAYTQNAKAILGPSDADTLADIQTAVSGINAEFAAAGVDTELNIVHVRPVFYLEQVNEDFHADLTNLAGTSDGYLDDLHALRDYYAADLVILVAGTWFYIYDADGYQPVVFDESLGFMVWEARGITTTGPGQFTARALGVDDAPPYELGNVAALNANRVPVANYHDSADRVLTPTELLVNGGFEIDMDGDGVPDFWQAKKWSDGDKRLCGKPEKAHSGACSLQFKLVVGDGNALKQSASGAAVNLNDEIALTGYTMSSSSACVKLKLVVKFVSLAKVKGNAEVCIAAADGWVSGTVSFTADDLVEKVNAKLKTGGTGKVWFDDLSVTATAGGGQ